MLWLAVGSHLFHIGMASVHVPSLTFNNGYKMPVIGLGTWKVSQILSHTEALSVRSCIIINDKL
jgi:hypothetical protein